MSIDDVMPNMVFYKIIQICSTTLGYGEGNSFAAEGSKVELSCVVRRMHTANDCKEVITASMKFVMPVFIQFAIRAICDP